MKLVVAYDTSVFIDRSIAAVFHTIAEAIILRGAGDLLLPAQPRATIIPIVTIPVSLVARSRSCISSASRSTRSRCSRWCSAIGLVVDDAIVVLENIFRHIEEGMPRKGGDRGREGDRLRGDRDDLTLTPCSRRCVRHRPHRALFIEFALTLAGAVLVSGFIALTLTPMMCSPAPRGTRPSTRGSTTRSRRGFRGVHQRLPPHAHVRAASPLDRGGAAGCRHAWPGRLRCS